MVTCYGNIESKHLNFQSCSYAKARYKIAFIGAHIAGSLIVISQRNVEVLIEEILYAEDKVTEEVFKKFILYNYTSTIIGNSRIRNLPSPQGVGREAPPPPCGQRPRCPEAFWYRTPPPAHAPACCTPEAPQAG